ncbi:hypothetical protein HYH03_002884 [Edaphochlamys debaryana]|uniref:AAA+ ATPase domain-containing protein n=1 Tax=Edaphochlamys debaryana TaxID=47281 RepID=A0A835YB00_9CHLO|nr:hypothetical protein HYH03_002884 [Edaphochlamys debaryana]|eukprot:KAG2499306.1 hypothetical protein HYH03_002884 [Edaphochlamys debaryana]
MRQAVVLRGRSAPCTLPHASRSARWTCPLRAHGPTRQRLSVKAIGFDFGDGESSSRAAPAKRSTQVKAVGTLAASLLVFGGVMKGSVGEAFLGALAATQKYQAAGKEVLAAYGRFYSLLLTAGYDSWQDYLLDQILLGRDNAFARAAAQGTLEGGAPVLRAVAYDLDVLQELSLGLGQVAELVSDTVPSAGPYWTEAASSVSIKARPGSVKALGAGAGGPLPTVTPIDPAQRSQYIRSPPSDAELAAWRAAISNKEAWSEAVPLLTTYYHLHGFGITSRNPTLRWVKGAFEEGADGSNPASPLPPLPALDSVRAALEANTLAHCAGRPAEHALVAGPSGSGKSALLWDYTLAAGRDKGLRLVDVGSEGPAAVLEAARGCGRYPRLRFVIVADHVDCPVRGAAAADLSAGLGRCGPSGWPENTLLYMAASSSSTLSYDAVTSKFGLILTTKELTEEQYGETLRKIAATAAGSEAAAALSDEDLAYAVEWARKQGGGLSVRAASQYVRRARQG